MSLDVLTNLDTVRTKDYTPREEEELPSTHNQQGKKWIDLIGSGIDLRQVSSSTTEVQRWCVRWFCLNFLHAVSLTTYVCTLHRVNVCA